MTGSGGRGRHRDNRQIVAVARHCLRAARLRISGAPAVARTGDHRTEIRELRALRHAADAELADAVHAGRAAGHSWDAIGRALGVTRQAAHDRFARRRNDLPPGAAPP